MRFRELKQNRPKTSNIEKPKYFHAKYNYRVKAFIIDLFMIYTPILYFVAYVVMSGKDDFQTSELAPLIAVTLYGLIYATLISKFGQTIGKRAYDIRVVDDKTGEYINFFRAVLRFFAFLFTATTLLGLFLPFFRKDKKALHDLICGTFVVIEKKIIDESKVND
ncbi:MAG: RDD family protein [Sulfurimonas sp.]|nr:RDD family protein [Sulfurimonas sp.]